MRQTLVNAVLSRGGHRCAWCTAKLGTSGVVCYLDVLDSDSSMVASCRECAGEYAKWWPFARAYSPVNVERFLGRCPHTQSSPFLDYLEKRMAGRGYQNPLHAAIARIEAQRNAPLDLRRKVA